MRLLLLSLVLLLSLQYSFGEWVLTDEAHQNWIEQQKISEALTAKDEKTISELEETLKQLQKKQQISEEITALDEKLIEKQEKSLKEQHTEKILDKIYNFFQGIVIGMSISLALYYANV